VGACFLFIKIICKINIVTQEIKCCKVPPLLFREQLASIRAHMKERYKMRLHYHLHHSEYQIP